MSCEKLRKLLNHLKGRSVEELDALLNADVERREDLNNSNWKDGVYVPPESPFMVTKATDKKKKVLSFPNCNEQNLLSWQRSVEHVLKGLTRKSYISILDLYEDKLIEPEDQ